MRRHRSRARPAAAAKWALFFAGVVLRVHRAAGQQSWAASPLVSWRGSSLTVAVPTAWRQLRGPIGTVCVTGDDRVGKSTLLSLWGQRLTGSTGMMFSAGHRRTSHTQGVWSTMIPSGVSGLKHHLNLCDSQGLKQIDEVQQWRLFSTNVLLPSVLVYVLINTLQNDQLRDLAAMAHQFHQLSAEDFRRFRPPHLIIVVREESDFDDLADGQDLNRHLEQVLKSRGFEEDKTLIRRVFRSREAWALHEMPREARRDLRLHQDQGVPLNAIAGAEAWSSSGDAILARSLHALDHRLSELPQSGLEYAEWCEAVVGTVNNLEGGSLGRLIGLSEQARASRSRQHLLQAWRQPSLISMTFVALLLGLGGFVGRWLDRAMWLGWVVFCLCFVGSSPFLRASLEGFAPRYCTHLIDQGNHFLRSVCKEASPLTGAVLLSAILGAFSYPLLMAQLRWLLGRCPVLRRLQGCGAGLLLVAGGCSLCVLDVDSLGERLESPSDMDVVDSWVALLLLVVVASGTELFVVSRRNLLCCRKSQEGRALHAYISGRAEEVHLLERSHAWVVHYSHHSPTDANWRFRRSPVARTLALFLQASVFLAWACLIAPHRDLVLSCGFGVNVYFVARRVVHLVRRAWRSADPVENWLRELESEDAEVLNVFQEEPDDGGEEPISTAVHAGGVGKGEGGSRCRFLPESSEELRQRRQIESMRLAQERACRWW